MSTSLLYHAFGIRGYDYVRTDYRGGQVIFTIAQDPDDCRCCACGSREVTSSGLALERSCARRSDDTSDDTNARNEARRCFGRCFGRCDVDPTSM